MKRYFEENDGAYILSYGIGRQGGKSALRSNYER